MTRVEQLYERLQRQLRDATKLLDEYHALEDRGSDAAKEKRAEFVKAKEAAEQTRADMKDAEQMSALADIQLVRTEQSPRSQHQPARGAVPRRGPRPDAPEQRTAARAASPPQSHDGPQHSPSGSGPRARRGDLPGRAPVSACVACVRWPRPKQSRRSFHRRA